MHIFNTLIALLVAQLFAFSVYGSQGDWQVVRSINEQINTSYRYTDRFIGDYRTVDEFILAGEGGCADFSLAKVHAIKAFLPHINVRWAYGYRMGRSQQDKVAHMVALVELEGQIWVLDNFVSGIYPIQQRTDLKLIFAFNKKDFSDVFYAEIIDKYGKKSDSRDIINLQTQHRLTALYQPPVGSILPSQFYYIVQK